MAEIRTVTTLRYRRDEILDSIKLYERQLEQAKSDLAHVLAAIRIFEASGDPKDLGRYMDVHRLFKRGETWTIAKGALASRGPLTTRELTVELMKAKALEAGDQVFARALNQRLIHSLSLWMHMQRGNLLSDGKRKGRHGLAVASGKDAGLRAFWHVLTPRWPISGDQIKHSENKLKVPIVFG